MANKESRLAISSNHSFRLKRSINDLLDDVLKEILTRLPCKFVVRYKSVSKRWLALISSPEFHLLFLRHPRRWIFQKQNLLDHDCIFNINCGKALIMPKLLALALEEDFGTVERQISIKFLNQIVRFPTGFGGHVFGYSNGLLLCSEDYGCPYIYYICNPLTKEWIELPPAPIMSAIYRTYMGFICDSYYHVDTDANAITINFERKFRVVRIPSFEIDDQYFGVDVFSSETGQWNYFVVLRPRGFACSNTPCGPGVVYKGKMYFLGSSGF
ncbi:F-box protein [Quillaja saponaria]|uniref:F-box protein n=1 Tax=Quillaja saponaria TaxID=32244 RepID=A0AAD7LZ12_QUISA|nr:F-box protein [Quillaja saponaria]